MRNREQRLVERKTDTEIGSMLCPQVIQGQDNQFKGPALGPVNMDYLPLVFTVQCCFLDLAPTNYSC